MGSHFHKPRLPLRIGTPVWLLALTALMVLPSCRTIDRTLQEAHIPCGMYRWRVKTLADPDAGSVRFEPIDTTVRDLAELPRPAESDHHARQANEFYVYRVKALLVAVHSRLDQDLHLLLRDPEDPEARLIAEIPNPQCTKASRYEPDFASARQVAEALKARGRQPLVEVTGVGFFDARHVQIGRARNGFELHPVLKLTEIEPEPSP